MDEELEYDVPAVTPPPAEPTEVVDVLDLDSTGRYTQNKRMKVIDEITKKLSQVEDPAMFSALFKGLSDMDKFAVNRKRIGIEEEAVKTDAEQARQSADLLRAITATALQSVGVPRAAPKLPETMGEPETVPGEMDADPGQMSYDSFSAGRAKPADK